MALKIQDRIYVRTHNGEREIQLCLGDITMLPKNETVDVIIVSAFPGDYIAMSRTVIGALKFQLGLSVEKLAKYYKKEDLRKHFSCWISDYLPSRLPFRQLMCFERSQFSAPTLSSAINDMFRAMQPLFNNQNKSVITPLLATGCQGAAHDVMLREIVRTAVMWMNMGLPLQTLKIVIYESGTRTHEVETCIALFRQMKNKIERRKVDFREPDIERDVFLVHSQNQDDKEIAEKIRNFLKKEMKTIRISTIADVETKESSWYHDVHNAMMASAKVVPLLSKAFLDDQICVDQYNIALCCNRFMTSRHILAPVCLDRFSVPTYMGMVQWINCRGREVDKLETAASILVEQIKSGQSGGENAKSKKLVYDVFISYSHRNVEKAKTFFKMLQENDSNLRIFFDYEELKTGVAWQKTLYHSIDGTRCFVALVSHDYAESTICNEEFNLALARYHAKDGDMNLTVVALDDIDMSGPIYAGLKLLDAQGDKFAQCTTEFVEPLIKWFRNGIQHQEIFSDRSDVMDLQQLAEQERKTQFSTLYKLNKDLGGVTFNALSGDGTEKDDTAKKVFFSYSLRDQGFVQFITKLLKENNVNFETNDKMADGTLELDSCSIMVVFLSIHYKRSPKEMEEFNLILSKHRSGHSKLYVIRVGALPILPTYLHLVPSYSNLGDEFWEDVLPVGQGRDILGETWFERMLEMIKECQSLYHTDLSMREALVLYKCACDLEMIISSEANEFYANVGYPKGIFVNVQLLQHRQHVLFESRKEIDLDTTGNLEERSPMHGDEEPSQENVQGKQDATNFGTRQVLDRLPSVPKDSSENDANDTKEITVKETSGLNNETKESQEKMISHAVKETKDDEKETGKENTSNESPPTANISEGREEAEGEGDTVPDLIHDNRMKKINPELKQKPKLAEENNDSTEENPARRSAACRIL